MILLFPKRNSALVSFRTTSLFCYPVSFEPICSENGMKDILCYMTTHLPDCILSENCILDIATNYILRMALNLIELPTTRLICDKKIATAVPLSLQMTRPRKEIKAKLSVVY